MTETGQLNTTSRVMVVDDDESIRFAITEILAYEGIGTLAANGGAECLRYLREGFRGVILMDVMMPGIDGWSTLREIKNAGLLEGNIISMLTALDAPDEKMDGLQEIVIDYITKPFLPDELIATVRNYLGYLDSYGKDKE
jgi:DNA-binding response OmpR family regulator